MGIKIQRKDTPVSSLPGALVATLTNLAMDTKEKLENADEDLFAMPDDSYEKQDASKKANENPFNIKQNHGRTHQYSCNLEKHFISLK